MIEQRVVNVKHLMNNRNDRCAKSLDEDAKRLDNVNQILDMISFFDFKLQIFARVVLKELIQIFAKIVRTYQHVTCEVSTSFNVLKQLKKSLSCQSFSLVVEKCFSLVR